MANNHACDYGVQGVLDTLDAAREDVPGCPGIIGREDAVTRAFTERGWIWGGTWMEPDYQHFSAA
ncbi:capsule synthesis protein PGA_cap [Tessaracoccus bendigoensis DSM 12906]|uniref:Capsule synthesis protein PGA_cap n=1 Tax=Tessaracoccus bendigoensis DSM 12906 TaxID=1123357 RepID=A0A1M6M946_9ACTN|nr:capsule synthesis protein PGA_cap [Tessaracoccus bendigoensis DSM 12906]